MRHPAEFFIKFLLIRDPTTTDAQILKALEDRGFLEPPQNYLGFLRQETPAPPMGFQPFNKLHRPSVQYLREQKVYDMFHPGADVLEAQDYLFVPDKRLAVEQVILARLDFKQVAQKLNRKHDWHLTAKGIAAYKHFFWNLNLLTFDQWGRYLYDRSAFYDRYMSLLQADVKLAFYHLRLDQVIESKEMIKDAQKIAYFTLKEVEQVPGVRVDKVKSIGTLTKAMTECHNALSTSDMALTGVLREFERWRMDQPQTSPPPIFQLAPNGNFSGSGIDSRLIEGEVVPSALETDR